MSAERRRRRKSTSVYCRKFLWMTFVQVHRGSDEGLLQGQSTGIDAQLYPVDSTDTGQRARKRVRGRCSWIPDTSRDRRSDGLTDRQTNRG